MLDNHYFPALSRDAALNKWSTLLLHKPLTFPFVIPPVLHANNEKQNFFLFREDISSVTQHGY